MLSPDDLAAMQSIVSARWRADGPLVDVHVGDLAWGANPVTGRDALGATFDGDAFAFRGGDEWYLGALPGAPYDRLVAVAAEAGAVVTALDGEPDKAAALARAGFAVDGSRWHWHLVHDLRDLPPVPLPVVSGATDPDARVALHRAAWEPSRFTRETYDGVVTTPPYRPDLDVVVTAPDGEWAAYALGWLDEASASGELEPVGTAPAFRRRGYGAAACVATLHRMRDLGARTAVVYAVSDPANQGPRALYESIGFRVRGRHLRHLPPTRQNAATR
ncbi:MAG TPA: GNAT family N-acetyltransferase [Mycobacteriales bacterium]|jgi:ribosomal protein S18 acetylase RimI-like enzyme|nr:GNAT family N-acetyltransferase [Mycobacteriales bacterium]